MGVYIDMEMPIVEDEFVEVLIFGDGKVIKTGKSWRCKEDGKCYYESLTPEEFFHAAGIPEPHGDLIDRDELKHVIGSYPLVWEYGQGVKDCWDALTAAQTIIPAEKGVT